MSSVYPSMVNPSYTAARCNDCRMVSSKDDIWMCVQCRGSWCDVCWDKIGAHNTSPEDDPFAFNVDSSIIGAHEKVTKEVFTRISQIFRPLQPALRTSAHEKESQAKWFGIYRGDGNQLYFGDTNRLTNIIEDSWTAENPDQYPSIVSFVGQTGMSFNCDVSSLNRIRC